MADELASVNQRPLQPIWIQYNRSLMYMRDVKIVLCSNIQVDFIVFEYGLPVCKIDLIHLRCQSTCYTS
jgi:hypothetical protein